MCCRSVMNGLNHSGLKYLVQLTQTFYQVSYLITWIVVDAPVFFNEIKYFEILKAKPQPLVSLNDESRNYEEVNSEIQWLQFFVSESI